MPVVLLVMALSRKISEGTNKKNRSKKLDVSAGLQEYLENIKLLRTTEAMGDYQQSLCKKVKRIIPGLVLYELLAGLSISISYNVMRVGLGLVILFGSGMLAAGEITLFKFLIFLYAAVRIYEPLTSACEHLGDFIASLVGAGRVSALLAEPEQGGSEDIIRNDSGCSAAAGCRRLGASVGDAGIPDGAAADGADAGGQRTVRLGHDARAGHTGKTQ